MPRRSLIRTDQFVYHVTARSNHKLWFCIPLSEVWNICVTSMKGSNKKHPVNIHAFVLMSNHYHLVLDTPNADIDKFMYEFNKTISLSLRRETGMINRMFGGRYKWSIIKASDHYHHVLKYVFRNPVKAGICNKVEDYPYSTVKLNEFGNTCKLNTYINIEKTIDWFNEGHSEVQNESINNGLKRTQFKYSSTSISRIPPSFQTLK